MDLLLLTLAGSSGSPLLLADTGELVGVHTGFDLNRFEAQAVTLQAVRSFLADTAAQRDGPKAGSNAGSEAGSKAGSKAGRGGGSRSPISRGGPAKKAREGDEGDGGSPLPLAERLAKRARRAAAEERAAR